MFAANKQGEEWIRNVSPIVDGTYRMLHSACKSVCLHMLPRVSNGASPKQARIGKRLANKALKDNYRPESQVTGPGDKLCVLEHRVRHPLIDAVRKRGGAQLQTGSYLRGRQ